MNVGGWRKHRVCPGWPNCYCWQAQPALGEFPVFSHVWSRILPIYERPFWAKSGPVCLAAPVKPSHEQVEVLHTDENWDKGNWRAGEEFWDYQGDTLASKTSTRKRRKYMERLTLLFGHCFDVWGRDNVCQWNYSHFELKTRNCLQSLILMVGLKVTETA